MSLDSCLVKNTITLEVTVYLIWKFKFNLERIWKPICLMLQWRKYVSCS